MRNETERSALNSTNPMFSTACRLLLDDDGGRVGIPRLLDARDGLDACSNQRKEAEKREDPLNLAVVEMAALVSVVLVLT